MPEGHTRARPAYVDEVELVPGECRVGHHWLIDPNKKHHGKCWAKTYRNGEIRKCNQPIYKADDD